MPLSALNNPPSHYPQTKTVEDLMIVNFTSGDESILVFFLTNLLTSA